MPDYEIDQGILKKKGWKIEKNFEKLGQETVAQKLAEAEGTTIEKARGKLKKAKKGI